MTDLIKALRGELTICSCAAHGSCECGCGAVWPEHVADDAADRIEELEASVATLNKALTITSQGNAKLKACVTSLTEQNAALIWERDGHGKSNVPDIFVQNVALTGENIILKSELAKSGVSGFYEDAVPTFVDGQPTHELQSLVDAAEVKRYVDIIVELRAELAALKQRDESNVENTQGYIKELKAELAKWKNVFGHLGSADECGNEWIKLSDELAALKAAPSHEPCDPEFPFGDEVFIAETGEKA